MINSRDLKIEEEILPLFDFTNNRYAKELLLGILSEYLVSKDEIIYRQQILKGFIAHHDSLKNYGYPRLELMEVHEFLSVTATTLLTHNKLRFQLLFSEKDRHRLRGKFSQLIIFFNRIYVSYLKKINTGLFPAQFETRLHNIISFLSILKVSEYDAVIKQEGLQVKQISELAEIIQLKLSKETIDEFWLNYFQFEAFLSISLAAVQYKFEFPVFTGHRLLLEDFYHPLLKHPVKNNFKADANVIILTGPNMSGKSTFLKAVSLCVYLAHLGLPVPAARAELRVFTNLSIAINLTDNLKGGYSHFMSELINLKSVVLEAQNNESSFAVFDELFRGTNVDDSRDITATTIKGLAKYYNSLFFVSTHLLHLNENAGFNTDSVAAYYVECIMQDNTPTFTYKLREGWSDLKIGRLLFQQQDLDRLLE